MIKSRTDLKEYFKADKKQPRITKRFRQLFTDEIWKFQIVLRKYEHWLNDNSYISEPMYLAYIFIHYCKSVKLEIGIALNGCKKRMSITHIDTIQTNGNAIIGENLKIQESVNIGESEGYSDYLKTVYS